jgi:pimeloyl-ACP methyl ester carboxylesterase
MSERPPVILVHGAFSRASHCDAIAAALQAAGFECLAPSLPGHDPSDPELLSHLSLEDYLAALDRVRSGLAAAPIVIGHSMGVQPVVEWLHRKQLLSVPAAVSSCLQLTRGRCV